MLGRGKQAITGADVKGKRRVIRAAGMMSGTSLDGVDLAVIETDGVDVFSFAEVGYRSYTDAERDVLRAALGKWPGEEGVAEAAAIVEDAHIDLASGLEGVELLGFHGQTLAHDPKGHRTHQAGDGARVAEALGIDTVWDFRSADVNAGGQGAPLAPLLHKSLFRDALENRAVLNIGGIANLTILPATGDVIGFDCGPGNCLMDGWTNRHLHKDYDNNGNWASKGETDPALLEHLLSDPYFELPAPKSTGLERFNINWLDNNLADSDIAVGTVQTTLAELTALSVANSLKAFPATDRLLVCGGGSHNAFLMRRLSAALPDTIVETTARFGADPDWVEGLLFAWLARERLNQKPQDTRLITGAKQPVLLGEIFEPPE